MEKKRIPTMSFILYILASLLAIYTIWSVYHSSRYISEMIATNQLIFRGNEYDIINFYMVNNAEYGLFAVILIALGWLIQSKNPYFVEKIQVRRKSTPEIKTANNDEENFEEWFKNNKD